MIALLYMHSLGDRDRSFILSQVRRQESVVYLQIRGGKFDGSSDDAPATTMAADLSGNRELKTDRGHLASGIIQPMPIIVISTYGAAR